MRVDIQALQQWQRQQAPQIVLQDDFANPVWIGGADVGFEQQGSITRAVVAWYYTILHGS